MFPNKINRKHIIVENIVIVKLCIVNSQFSIQI